ncbi:carbohydrate binding domain-containing protein [Pseudobacteriovorax antillogorgiicola]|uniref:Carbohydrate binding domain-containing protein n=1 Tax=Pseudobacteriovorax antillogorgiicola TaxID=1513793 RepID=A0A1Y6BPQ1_9BACT|nr:carbohydrate binding domain-containing protein [Pseudobacteriovorax antillogorgiicola]TCS54512.1 carbohydrate binding protein [Pseudobacteriovorax antillogorgiicola]SMF18943.1 Carbohydrate binding domain-containing protein [Pseudobacteriovorax antillogorgiicola]
MRKLLVACLTFMSGFASANAELIENPSFDLGLENWSTNNGGVKDQGYFEAYIQESGDAWEGNLSYGLPIEDKKYKLRFRAKSDRSRDLLAGIGMFHSPWTAELETVRLGQEWTRFELTLQSNFGADDESRVIFDFGHQKGLVQIDDVSLTILDSSANPHPVISYGPYQTTRQVYAPLNLDYQDLVTNPIIEMSGTSYTSVTNFADYHMFNNAMYRSAQIDMSSFGLGNDKIYPARVEAAPLTGVFYKPESLERPAPLAIFLHGNHSPQERSGPGYEPYCESLASHGFIAVTVDMNFMNEGSNNEARAILLLEHLKQFKIWNDDPQHELYQKIDMNQVMVVGHSRGGRAAALAPVFNQYSLKGQSQAYFATSDSSSIAIDGSVVNGFGPWDFKIKTVVALAPTTNISPVSQDGTRTPDYDFAVPANYFHVNGGRDGDVGRTSGYKTYYNANPIEDLSTTSPSPYEKGLLYVRHGNHNGFNSVWAEHPEYSLSCSRYILCYDSRKTLCKDDQLAIARAYIQAVALGSHLGDESITQVLKDKNSLQQILPRNVLQGDCETPLGSLKLTQAYHGKDRLFIQHFEGGDNESVFVENDLGITGHSTYTGSCESSFEEIVSGRGLKLSCPEGASESVYSLYFDESIPRFDSRGERLDILSFDFRHLARKADVHIKVRIVDDQQNAHELSTRDLFSEGHWQAPTDYLVFFGGYNPWSIVLEQTVRVPFDRFSSHIDTNGIQQIDLVLPGNLRNLLGEPIDISYILDNIYLTR